MTVGGAAADAASRRASRSAATKSRTPRRRWFAALLRRPPPLRRLQPPSNAPRSSSHSPRRSCRGDARERTQWQQPRSGQLRQAVRPSRSCGTRSGGVDAAEAVGVRAPRRARPTRTPRDRARPRPRSRRSRAHGRGGVRDPPCDAPRPPAHAGALEARTGRHAPGDPAGLSRRGVVKRWCERRAPRPDPLPLGSICFP